MLADHLWANESRCAALLPSLDGSFGVDLEACTVAIQSEPVQIFIRVVNAAVGGAYNKQLVSLSTLYGLLR